jgi:hypothetical protein
MPTEDTPLEVTVIEDSGSVMLFTVRHLDANLGATVTKLMRVGPVSVNNFVLRYSVFVLEGCKKRPRLVGTVIGSRAELGVMAFALKIAEADRTWETYRNEQAAKSRFECQYTWELSL